MKCSKCGANLTEDTIFCSYCGAKVEKKAEKTWIPIDDKKADEPQKEEKYSYQNNKNHSAASSSIATSYTDKIKEKLFSIWEKLSKFGKLTAIGITIFVILGSIAFLGGRIFAGVIAVAQIVILVVAILMKRQIVKVPKNGISLLMVVLSFALMVPYFCLFKIDLSDNSKYEWKEIMLAELLPKPKSSYGEIISNSKDSLSLDVTNTNEKQYRKYIVACKNKGFTIDAETTEDDFDAYNDNGDKLSISYYDNEMHIDLDAAMELGGLIWSDSEMAKLLPVPKSTIGNVQQDNKNRFIAYIGETSIKEYNVYVKSCEDKGFNVDINKTEKVFSAKNGDAYTISVEYIGGNVICISVGEPEFDVNIEIKCVKNIIFSKYDVETYIDDDYEGTISHGDKETYSLSLTKGKHMINFQSAEDDTLDGKMEVNITKNETIKLRISCSSSGIDSEIITDSNTADNKDKTSKNKKQESASETPKADDGENETEKNLTVKNCHELAAMLKKKAEVDESYSDFADKYTGRVIEFDGRIDYCTTHENYKTRFDYLVSAGDYDPDHQIGPTFKFDNVAYYDLNTDLDTVSIGLNVRIVAEVDFFDSNSGLFYLDPISITKRKKGTKH